METAGKVSADRLPDQRGSCPFRSPLPRPRRIGAPSLASGRNDVQAERHDAADADFAPERWERLARPLGLDPAAACCIALSGGADSVYLLHLVAAARPRPRIVAVHVDHGLRGAESEADARFCAELTTALSVEFELRKVALEPEPAGLEARARAARYRELADAARVAQISTILTAHHADDALETLILRWVRGSELAALPALRPKLLLRAPPLARPRRPEGREVLRAAGRTLLVARPLLALRRAEIRAALQSRGLAWREDASNADRRFARNALRLGLLPAIADACGPEALENLHAFGAAVAQLEDRLAARTAPIAWAPPRHAAARRAPAEAQLGGTLARGELLSLPEPLARRALARLLAEATGDIPHRAALDRLIADLFAGRTGWHQIAGGWRLQLRSDRIDLEPPPHASLAGSQGEHASHAGSGGDVGQLELPFAAAADARATSGSLALPAPGGVTLPDGRRITADLVDARGAQDVSRSPLVAELDARDLPLPLSVRMPRPGDRFRAIGAPGAKSLARFLADVGVPRHDRDQVPLVLAGAEIVWVAGVRPCEARRVRAGTGRRLRLVLR